jgi:hypothetical protein
MPDTLFAYLKGSVSNANDTDPEQSSAFRYPPLEAVHNVVSYRGETVSLDLADTRSVTLPSGITGWVGFMARVIGHAKLTTVGVNWDNSTPITGVTGGFGTDRHPGYISMVTENVTTFTLEGLADGTQVEYLIMTLAQDDEL